MPAKIAPSLATCYILGVRQPLKTAIAIANTRRQAYIRDGGNRAGRKGSTMTEGTVYYAVGISIAVAYIVFSTVALAALVNASGRLRTDTTEVQIPLSAPSRCPVRKRRRAAIPNHPR